MVQDWSASLCRTRKHFMLIAPCPTLCRAWHHARALFPHLYPPRPQQRGVLTETLPTTGTSPQTVSSLNTRIYASDPCPSTSRSEHQPITNSAASRRSWSRTLLTNTFVLCWLHHCTYRSEEQVQNDRTVIILNEEAWCPVQDPATGGPGKLVGAGKLVAVFSSQSRLNQDTCPVEANFP